MHELILVPTLLLLLIRTACCNEQLIRHTVNGPVQGVEETSSLGQKFFAFKGIPYAEPPITGKDPFTGLDVDRRFKVCWHSFWRNEELKIVVFEFSISFVVGSRFTQPEME